MNDMHSIQILRQSKANRRKVSLAKCYNFVFPLWNPSWQVQGNAFCWQSVRLKLSIRNPLHVFSCNSKLCCWRVLLKARKPPCSKGTYKYLSCKGVSCILTDPPNLTNVNNFIKNQKSSTNLLLIFPKRFFVPTLLLIGNASSYKLTSEFTLIPRCYIIRNKKLLVCD